MNLQDLDFSKRLPFDFHKTVQMPVFPRRGNWYKSASLDKSSINIIKNKSLVTSSNFSFKKQLHSNTRNKMWSELKFFPFTQTIPSRSYHSVVLHDNNIYVYGGWDRNTGNLGDFMRLNYSKNEKEMKWEAIPVRGLSPGKICRHGSFSFKNRIYVFGGKKNVYNNSNDIYYYDLESEYWFQIYMSPNELKPKKIDSFSLNLDVKNERAIIFGGYYGKFTNNLFSFQIKQMKWEKIIAKGRAPEKRAGHCSVLYKDKILLISGGGDFVRKFNDMWQLDLELLIWHKVETNESIYQPGIGHSMVLYGDYIVMFGGIGEAIHEKNDIVVHNLIRGSWKKISFDSEEDIEFLDPSSNTKSLKKNTTKPGLGFLPRSNTKAPTAILSSLPSLPKRNSLKAIMDEFSTQKNSKDNKINFDEKRTNSTFHEQTVKIKEENRSEKKHRSPKSMEKSKARLSKSSIMKKIFQDPVLIGERINETKKKHLLEQFEVFDEKLKREFLHITPTTELMKTTITIFKNPNKEENDNKRRKIVATSFEFKKKESCMRVNGNAPCPRDGHSSIVIGHKMLVIGGDRQQRQYNDIFECDLQQLFE